MEKLKSEEINIISIYVTKYKKSGFSVDWLLVIGQKTAIDAPLLQSIVKQKRISRRTHLKT